MKTHWSTIFSLKPLQGGRSARELRKLIIAFEVNLMENQALKVVILSNDFAWVHVLTKKLDQFEQDQSGKDPRMLQQLTDFINRGVQASEVSGPRAYRS